MGGDRQRVKHSIAARTISETSPVNGFGPRGCWLLFGERALRQLTANAICRRGVQMLPGTRMMAAGGIGSAWDWPSPVECKVAEHVSRAVAGHYSGSG